LSKYDAIADFLISKNQNEVRLLFIDLENAIGFSLPASARKYPEWWANNKVEGRHCNSWMNAGWITRDVDIGSEKVTFIKDGFASSSAFLASANIMNTIVSPSVNKTHIAEPVIAPDGILELEMKMYWLEQGEITIDESGKLAFPPSEKSPGLYRMRFHAENSDRTYIGETINLKRRFAHYRNPGPSQSTNIRINTALIEHISNGNSVTIDTVTGGSTLNFDGNRKTPNFANKATRRLFEHAAIVLDSASDIESLNL